jgi:hypothetical protein
MSNRLQDLIAGILCLALSAGISATLVLGLDRQIQIEQGVQQ